VLQKNLQHVLQRIHERRDEWIRFSARVKDFATQRCNTRCNKLCNTRCNTHCNVYTNEEMSGFCLARGKDFATKRCNNTRCNTSCNTSCNVHTNEETSDVYLAREKDFAIECIVECSPVLLLTHPHTKKKHTRRKKRGKNTRLCYHSKRVHRRKFAGIAALSLSLTHTRKNTQHTKGV